LNITSAGNYTLNNITYTVSGTYTQLLSNAAHCDSILTLNLIIQTVFIISDTSVVTSQDSSITFCTTIFDIDTGAAYSASLCGITNGTASITITGKQLCVTYTPNLKFNGLDSICLVVCDNQTPAHCDTVHIKVTVIPVKEILTIPDAFSPNEDGVNDYFIIPGIENYPRNTITIFNRWGNLLYNASPYKNQWDGSAKQGIVINGEKLPTGTYFMILDLNEEGKKPIKKYIYLSR
jgi:gliding motility-associated-like protein